MLISENHNFIFIHIYKNAGSSISRALMPFCSNHFRIFAHRVLRIFHIQALNPIPYRKHIKAEELVEEMGRDLFDSYFSFAVVRNPWDWNVSLYKYLLADKNHFLHERTKSFKDFDEYIKDRCQKSYATQKKFIYSKNGEKLVDYIARFENLEQDFLKICSIIGIQAELPHINKLNNTHYREYYTDETRELVRHSHKTDIDLFEYEF
ncbi:MAG: sulfotransferase family 2 domain-containing protein [Bacteroidetes bacterium]|jgi:hypothetical protein|nr:sulfotransferase family 2 domain-containing protein [Bacteroidota bacterium]